MATKETIIIELDFDSTDSRKRAIELNKNVKTLTQSQKELKKQGEEGSIQFQKNSEALKANKKELAENNKAIQNINTANKAQAGSNEQLKAQLSLLTAEYNKLSKEERETGARGKELNAQINQTTDDLKGNEEAVGDNRRSVGDYGKALSSTPFGSFIGGIKAMGAAFLANPLAIIILAIVGAFKLLSQAFVSTEKGQNKMAKATAVISTIFQKFLDILEPVADFIADKIGKAFEDLGTAIDLVAEGISSLLELMNFDEAAESLDRFVASQANAIKGAQLVADARAKIDKLDRELVVETARVQAQASDAREKALQSENISAEERNRLLNESADAIDGLAAKEEKAATLRLKAIQLENAITLSSKEALDAEADAQAELFNVQKRRSDAQKSLARDQLRVENELKKAGADRVKAVLDGQKEEIANSKLALELFIAQQGERARTLEQQLALAEQIRDKELDILQKQLDAQIINQTQFEIRKLAIQQDFLNLQTEQVIDNADRELEIILEANQSKLDANQFFSDELFAQEQERLQKSLDAQIAFEQTRLEQGVISQTEFNDAINAANEENAEAIKVLEEEKALADEEARIVDMANQRETDLLNREDEFLLRQEDLDRQKVQEIANAEATGADLGLINAKFAALEKKLDQEKFANKLAIASTTFGNLSEIAGKESAAGKAFAIAQTTIDTFVGAQAAFNSLASIPIIGSVLGAIAAAAAVAGGIARVNKIKNTKPGKAAKGGLFGGKPHSSGGTKGYFDDGTQIEVEKGEIFAVLNKNSSAMIQNMSDANVAGGGVAFGGGGTKSFLQDGGVGLDAISGPVESDNEQSNQIIEAVEAIPAPIVIVQDINEAVTSGIEVEQRAIV